MSPRPPPTPHRSLLTARARARCSENRDKTETYLAFGASRFEACKPVAKEALRLALTPTINQMRYPSPPPLFLLPPSHAHAHPRAACSASSRSPA